MKWDERLDRVYNDLDAAALSDEDIEVGMQMHIKKVAKMSPHVLVDHDFVQSAFDWFDKATALKLFEVYHTRLLSDKAFAFAAVGASPVLVRRFDVSPAPFYEDLCAKAVSASWRMLRFLDADRCGGAVMQGICKQAFDGAHRDAQRKRIEGKRNAFVIKYVHTNVIPVARAAGVPGSVVDSWTRKLENERVD